MQYDVIIVGGGQAGLAMGYAMRSFTAKATSCFGNGEDKSIGRTS